MNIIHLLFSDSYGGAEKVAIDIITFTKKYTNSLYVSHEGNIEEKLKEHNINYLLLKKINIFNLNDVIDEYEIDIIHAHDFKASIIASFFHRKVEIISHIHQSPTWLNKTKNIKYIIYKSLLKRFRRVFITSDEIGRTKLFYNNKKSKVLPNYVKVNNNLINNKNKRYNYIFVGRLEEIKQPFKFLDMIEKLQEKHPNIQAVIIGNGSLYSNIKDAIIKRKLNIEMLGFVNNPHYYISKADFLVNTSLKEGFGLASVEAMQLGVPVITYKNGGVSDEIQSGRDGIIINNESDLISKATPFLIDKEQYNSLSKNSKKLGNRFGDREKWVEFILGEYYVNK